MDVEVPAGWYKAPDVPRSLRYWDGELWTRSIKPVDVDGQPTTKVAEAAVVLEALAPDETIEAGFSTRVVRPTYYVATSHRVLIVAPSGIRNHEVTSLDYDGIDMIETEGLGDIALEANGREYHDLSVVSQPVNRFVGYVHRRVSQPTDGDLMALPPPSAFGGAEDRTAEHTGPAGLFEPESPVSISDELVKLADLFAEGLLTDEEFRAAKARLLDDSV